MAPSSLWKLLRPPVFTSAGIIRSFRSDAVLEALAKASDKHTPKVLALYNYPSISGAFSALFAHLYHLRINVPCLILPFSSAVPLSVEDLCIGGLSKCYFLDFLGPDGFALELNKKTSCKIVGFDHRTSSLSVPECLEKCNGDIAFHVNLDRSSCTSVYEYFSDELSKGGAHGDTAISIIDPDARERIELLLKYIEDRDLCKWNLPDSRAFDIGIRQWLPRSNCFTNRFMYEQLMGLSSNSIIDEGNSWISAREAAASKLLDKVFKVHLGRGFYGECLGTRADGNSDLSDEIGKELSKKSAAAGLRPIGAVVYMQRKRLKMRLISTDTGTDTSEIAKAYGGGGSPSSSSFIIRMDEYNAWRATPLSSNKGSTEKETILPRERNNLLFHLPGQQPT